MRLLVTGGCGFIGSMLVRRALDAGYEVLNLDALTYAADPEILLELDRHPRHRFERVDVCDCDAVEAAFASWRPDAVAHLAAESHVDRSIDAPAAFIETNVVGAFTMLQAARNFWRTLDARDRARFRFLQMSTDEVFGALGAEGRFSETTAYAPNSPYSASKAAADMLARAWSRTYGLPVIVVNCSNNYGPRQFPEKLIPLVIFRALAGRQIPVYGAGENVRDWIYVEDAAEGVLAALERGRPGESYCLGGEAETRNVDLVRLLCRMLDRSAPDGRRRPHEQLIEFVQDRPGHDFRYAIDGGKAARELGWRPRVTLEEGLSRTLDWYLANQAWRERLLARGAAEVARGVRLGLEARAP